MSAFGLAFSFLWFSTGWQNSIRSAMDIAPVESIQPIYVVGIATIPAAALVGLGTVLTLGVKWVAHWIAKVTPPRVAFVGAMIVVGTLTAAVGQGVIGRALLSMADRFYGDLDRLVGSSEAPPDNPLQSGNPASLIPWDTIGQDARVFVQEGPTAAEISEITGKPAIEPIRVYVGLRSAETPEARAQLALREMDRVGAFDRSLLVLVMPVGTGWIEPSSQDVLEFLHGGDIASVAVQYSYLTSALSLVVEPEVGLETARTFFNAVYARWKTLPKDNRPRLYLHGLSLGAYSSVASTTLFDTLSDPIDGALWAGTPFASPVWIGATRNRESDTPWWRPGLGDGSVVRFTNGQGDLETDSREWGMLRAIFLQYPSDPIVFFEPAMLWRSPEWLVEPRAGTISALLNWYPVVTFLQVALDMALAQTPPIGFGHNYSPEDYLDAWVAVTHPASWTPQELSTLRKRIARQGQFELVKGGWFREIERSGGNARYSISPNDQWLLHRTSISSRTF